MDDLISRQAAIDVLATMQGRCTSKAALIQNSKIWQQIKDLPSAQPDLDEVYAHAETEAEARFYCEIVRCKDCIFWVAHNKRCVYLDHGFAPNMWCCHGRRADG